MSSHFFSTSASKPSASGVDFLSASDWAIDFFNCLPPPTTSLALAVACLAGEGVLLPRVVSGLACLGSLDVALGAVDVTLAFAFGKGVVDVSAAEKPDRGEGGASAALAWTHSLRVCRCSSGGGISHCPRSRSPSNAGAVSKQLSESDCRASWLHCEDGEKDAADEKENETERGLVGLWSFVLFASVGSAPAKSYKVCCLPSSPPAAPCRTLRFFRGIMQSPSPTILISCEKILSIGNSTPWPPCFLTLLFLAFPFPSSSSFFFFSWFVLSLMVFFFVNTCPNCALGARKVFGLNDFDRADRLILGSAAACRKLTLTPDALPTSRELTQAGSKRSSGGPELSV